MKSQNRIYTFPSYGITSGHVAHAIKDSAQRYHIVGFLPIAALYLVLGFYQIDDQSLWTDEVISLERTLSGTPTWTLLKSQSPLYFSLLTLWSKLVGNSEFALRSLSTLLGIIAIFITYRVGLTMFDRRAAFLGAMLLATSPFLIWYAQEVRYITLLLVTSLAMTYSFHRALSTSGWRWWVLYSVMSVLAIFTFVTIVFLIIAHGLFLLWRRSERLFLKKWVASQLMIMVAFTAWFVIKTSHESGAVMSKAPSIVSHEQVRSRGKLPVTDIVGTIPYTFFAFSVGFSLGPSLNELHMSRSIDSLLNHRWILVPTTLLFVTLFILGLIRLRQKETGTLLFLWLGVPIVGAVSVAMITTYHVYNTRYVAFALPAYLFTLAAGLTGIRRPQIRVFMVVSLLVVNSISLYNYYFDPRFSKEDARAAARYLETTAQSGDVILAVGSPRALRYYYEGSLPIKTIDARRVENHVLTENLRKAAKDRNRLWLVQIRPWQTDPRAKIKPLLDKLARRVDHREFAGVEIDSYVH